MKFALQVLVLLALPLFSYAADVVVPVDSVENSVNVRMEADARSEIVGRLMQGSSLPHQGSIPGWHEVRLEDDAYGYVSEDWANVISEEEFAAREVVTEDKVADETVAVEEAEGSEASETAEQAKPEVIVDEMTQEPSDESAVDETDGASETAEVSPEPVVDDTDEVAEESPDTVVEDLADGAEELSGTVAEESTEVAEDTERSDDSTADVAPTVAVVPVVTTGAQGPAGPMGPQGPPGPTGSSTVDGTEDFLMKFTDRTEGGNSQVFDDGRNVGIGTTEPKQRLEVNGNIQIHEQNSNVVGLMLTQASGGMGYIMHNRADTLTIGAGSVDRMTIDRDGNVGIGTERPSHPIEMASGAYVSAGGVWTNSSSREKKDNIVALTPDEALAALVALEPVRFNYKQDESEEYVGFIAEDVPGLVASTDRSSLSTMDIVAVLTRVVQEQQQKIEELEIRLDNESRE